MLQNPQDSTPPILILFPDTKFAIGPAIDAGFYYDLDNSHVFTSEDLTKLEAEMKKIVKEGYTLERKVVTREEALERFRSIDEDYKIELIENHLSFLC